jgi:hypothetical protein
VKYVPDNQIIGRSGRDKIFNNPPHRLSPIVYRLAVSSPRSAVLQRSQFVAQNASLGA